MAKNSFIHRLTKGLGLGAAAFAVGAIALVSSVGQARADVADNVYNTSTPHIRIQKEDTSVDPATYPNRFQAVQIFAADVDLSGDNQTASNISYGRSIDATKLINNMLDSQIQLPTINGNWTVPDGIQGDKDADYSSATNFGELFAAYLKKNVAGLDGISAGSGNHDAATTSNVSAPVVARFLNAFAYGAEADTAFAADSPFDATQSAVAKAFASIAAKSLTTSEVEGQETQGSTPNRWTSFGIAEGGVASSTITDNFLIKNAEGSNGQGWVIDSVSDFGAGNTSQTGTTSHGIPTGYYLVLDKFNQSSEHEVLSEYLLNLVDTEGVVVSVKSSKPEMTKSATVDGVDNLEAASVAVNDEVTFVLKGTIPENISSYAKYKMEFKDTLGTALTISQETADVHVYFGDAESDGLAAIKALKEIDSPTVSVTAPNLTVTIDDLLTAQSSETPLEDINSTKAVFVVYKAKVNNTATSGTDADTKLKNDAYMVYSNDPNWNGQGDSPTGTTPKDEVQLYTYGLDIKKLKGTDTKSGVALEGAGFSVLKSDGAAGTVTVKELVAGSEIALFDENTPETGVYTFNKWHTLTADDFDEQGKLKDEIESLHAIAKGASETGISKIRGLDEGSYTVVESLTPDGYNTMAPFGFNYTADEELTRCGLTVTGNTAGVNPNLVAFSDAEGVFEGQGAPGDGRGEYSATSQQFGGIGALSVINEPGLDLPFTGGAGYALYGAGIALLVGGAIYIIARKRQEDIA